MKNIIIGLFFIFLCFITSFGLYLQQKGEIYYIESSPLYQYCEDYYYSNGRNFSYVDFLKIIERKDKKLYTFLKEKKYNFTLGKGFVFVRSEKTKNIIKNADYSFFEFLFSNKNVLIEEKIYRFYEFNYVYNYKEGVFVKENEFNVDVLAKEQANSKGSKEIKFSRDLLYQEHSKSAKISIQNGKILFFNAEFDQESQSIIKKVLENMYSARNKDTIMINLRFFNIEDAECVDNKKQIPLVKKQALLQPMIYTQTSGNDIDTIEH